MIKLDVEQQIINKRLDWKETVAKVTHGVQVGGMAYVPAVIGTVTMCHFETQPALLQVPLGWSTK